MLTSDENKERINEWKVGLCGTEFVKQVQKYIQNTNRDGDFRVEFDANQIYCLSRLIKITKHSFQTGFIAKHEHRLHHSERIVILGSIHLFLDETTYNIIQCNLFSCENFLPHIRIERVLKFWKIGNLHEINECIHELKPNERLDIDDFTCDKVKIHLIPVISRLLLPDLVPIVSDYYFFISVSRELQIFHYSK